jgi:hypothetical protein
MIFVICLFLGMAITGLPMDKLVRPLMPFLAAIVADVRPGDRPLHSAPAGLRAVGT